MHETLHTYRFWVFGEKTPSLLFMLREEELFFDTTISNVLMINIQASWRYFPKLHFRRSMMYLFVTMISPFFQSVFPKIDIIFRSYATCSMMYDAYVVQRWCDDVMLCKVIFRRYTHICAIKYIIFLWISVDFSL